MIKGLIMNKFKTFAALMLLLAIGFRRMWQVGSRTSSLEQEGKG